MDQGPVPSGAYRLVAEDVPKPNWSRPISPPLGDYEVELRGEPPDSGLLSPAEENLLRDVFAECGARNRGEIVRAVHQLPEWRDPRGGSFPIPIRDILEAEGWAEPDIHAVLAELESAEAGRGILRGRS